MKIKPSRTKKAKSSNVVSLRGEPIRPPGVPSPDIIKLAEDILTRAKSGDLRALSVSFCHADDSHSFWHEGPVTIGGIGNIERMKKMLLDLEQSS